jgi:hypothetical protein
MHFEPPSMADRVPSAVGRGAGAIEHGNEHGKLLPGCRELYWSGFRCL